jgi:hypothetical protein
MSMLRGSLAGAVAAAVWAAAEPGIARRLGIPWYSDVRLLGRLLPTGRAWPAVGLASHLVNGALFGAAFERIGGRGWKQGLLAAQAENAVLWAGMVVIDRVHQDRRSGAWPPLFTNPRVAAHEAAVHALFGVVLGALVADERVPSPQEDRSTA